MAVTILQQVIDVDNTLGVDYKPSKGEIVTITAGDSVQIIATASGMYRNGSINFAPITDSRYATLYALWKKCKDESKGCGYWDREENQFDNDLIGTSDGVTTDFQLMKGNRVIEMPIHNFGSAPGRLYVDGLTDPRDGLDGLQDTIILTHNGVDVSYSDYDIDEETGIASFHSAPSGGHPIRVRDGYFLNCVIFPMANWPLETKSSVRHINALMIQEVKRA